MFSFNLPLSCHLLAGVSLESKGGKYWMHAHMKPGDIQTQKERWYGNDWRQVEMSYKGH